MEPLGVSITHLLATSSSASPIFGLRRCERESASETGTKAANFFASIVDGKGRILVEGWRPISLQALGYIVAASLLLAAGYQFVVLALRSGGELSVIGTFRYSSILWALAIGYAVWGEVPNGVALLGIAVIVASGLYILHRERVRR